MFDSTVLAMRVDGGGPDCGINERVTLKQNVAWKVSGYSMKGDRHIVDGNLALDMKQLDDKIVDAEDDPDCKACNVGQGMKMPFVRKNGCTTDENGREKAIPCIQNDNSELTNNAFMYANGDRFRKKFNRESKCKDPTTFTTCPKTKQDTKGQGYYAIHAGKKMENNYYGDFSYDCGEEYGTKEDEHGVQHGLGYKVVVDGVLDETLDARNFTDYFVDIYNFYFRPDVNYPNNPLTSTGTQIGPYPSVINEGEEYYFIPGRREEKATFPIPKDGNSVQLRQELMFRPAYE